jgi:8-oxo-dGTP diphosphatase
MSDNQRPKCGVGVLIIKDKKVLLGKRKNSHGAGSYGSGGGHLEFGESFEQALVREIKEETSLEVENIKFLCLSNFVVENKHYIDVAFTADWKSGKPTVMEPEKFESWDWFDTDNIPSPLFKVVENYFIALKTGRQIFDLNN